MKYKPTKLTDILRFGKYKGKTLKSVINDDPKYVNYLIKKINNFSITHDANYELQERFDTIGIDYDEPPFRYCGDEFEFHC